MTLSDKESETKRDHTVQPGGYVYRFNLYTSCAWTQTHTHTPRGQEEEDGGSNIH